MADLATLQARLATLEQAQIDLATGKAVVRISDPDLGSLQFHDSPAAFDRLDTLIARTRAEINLLQGTGGPFAQRYPS